MSSKYIFLVSIDISTTYLAVLSLIPNILTTSKCRSFWIKYAIKWTVDETRCITIKQQSFITATIITHQSGDGGWTTNVIQFPNVILMEINSHSLTYTVYLYVNTNHWMYKLNNHQLCGCVAVFVAFVKCLGSTLDLIKCLAGGIHSLHVGLLFAPYQTAWASNIADMVLRWMFWAISPDMLVCDEGIVIGKVFGV